VIHDPGRSKERALQKLPIFPEVISEIEISYTHEERGNSINDIHDQNSKRDYLNKTPLHQRAKRHSQGR
jgi:hypothetical protein